MIPFIDLTLVHKSNNYYQYRSNLPLTNFSLLFYSCMICQCVGVQSISRHLAPVICRYQYRIYQKISLFIYFLDFYPSNSNSAWL